jgi:uncharacterized protein (DUF2384 family)
MTHETPDQSLVLSKALLNTASHLGISNRKLAAILGVSTDTVQDLYADRYRLSPHTKEWDFAVLLVRLYRSLDSIVGGSADDAKKWLVSENGAFAGRTPAEMIETTEGIVRVASYLDSYRALV